MKDMNLINETHSPSLLSWVASANVSGNDFPIQNLPFGVCVDVIRNTKHVVVAIGDQVLDVYKVFQFGLLSGLAKEAAESCSSGRLNELMALGSTHSSSLRSALSYLLSKDCEHQSILKNCLLPMKNVRMVMPVAIGNYSDFFTSIHHATNSGRLSRPDNPLLPNFKHLPVAYHSRTSSIVLSGTPCSRPSGQIKNKQEAAPRYVPTGCLDFECEVGFYVGKGTQLTETILIEDAGEHIFGLTLLNDWSARDMQTWESPPLGPFLAKSFMTSVSPWVITLEALAPFRTIAASRGDDAPDLLPYLNSKNDRDLGGIDLSLEISLQSTAMREKGIPPMVISRPKFKDQYWTIFQMLTHQASNGCNVLPGDLLGSGTVSGPVIGELGCMKEITLDGDQPVNLPTGEKRKYLEKGDDVYFYCACSATGYKSIGFGSCTGHVVN
jgi:fumarylacetoacetase